MSCFHRQTWKQKYFYKIQRNMKPSVWSGNRLCCIPFRKKMPAILKFSGGWLPLQRALAKLLVMRVLSEVSSLCSYSSVAILFTSLFTDLEMFLCIEENILFNPRWIVKKLLITSWKTAERSGKDIHMGYCYVFMLPSFV